MKALPNNVFDVYQVISIQRGSAFPTALCWMNGDPVVIRYYEDSNEVCSDCGSPAKYLVTRMNGSKFWYCGICDIGG